MRKPEIVLAAEFSPDQTELLELEYIVHKPWEAADADGFLDAIGPRVRAIATLGSHGAGKALMARLPNLEIVACFGVGVDAIDLDYARSRGVRVTNTPEVLTEDVADMAMALMLATTRRIPFGDRWVREGRWARGPMPLTSSIRGKTLGVFGLGRIGRAVAQRAQAFGMDILYTGRVPHADAAYGWRPDAVALARASDVLVLCAAGGPDTEAIIGAEALAALGPKGFLINIARGSLIDEGALINALKTGAIAGAGLDVYRNEPNIRPEFRSLDTLVLQPHNGSGTRETRGAIGDLMRANLAAHFAGRPLLTPVI